MPPTDSLERSMNAEVIAWAHDELGIGYREIGRVVRASERTVLRWKSRESLASPRHRLRLQGLNRLKYLLSCVFRDAEGAHGWLHAPCLPSGPHSDLIPARGEAPPGAGGPRRLRCGGLRVRIRRTVWRHVPAGTEPLHIG
jgi:hypothetical protein